MYVYLICQRVCFIYKEMLTVLNDSTRMTVLNKECCFVPSGYGFYSAL